MIILLKNSVRPT